MLKLSRMRTMSPLLCLVLMLLVTVIFAQKKEQDLEKKYAVVLGDYEFDMTDAGMGVMKVNFYFEDGAVWAWPEVSSDPSRMTPVEGKEFEFTIDSPTEGTYEIKFLKDESGKYTKCHVKNEIMGMDVVGTKVKK